eukprot:751476-Hanusia_phi.AAC.1
MIPLNCREEQQETFRSSSPTPRLPAAHTAPNRQTTSTTQETKRERSRRGGDEERRGTRDRPAQTKQGEQRGGKSHSYPSDPCMLERLSGSQSLGGI